MIVDTEEMRVAGYRDTCYFCDSVWGKCKCDKPEPDNEIGFDWHEFWIVDPSLDVTRRYFVDPNVYYGEAYVNFTRKSSDKG